MFCFSHSVHWTLIAGISLSYLAGLLGCSNETVEPVAVGTTQTPASQSSTQSPDRAPMAKKLSPAESVPETANTTDPDVSSDAGTGVPVEAIADSSPAVSPDPEPASPVSTPVETSVGPSPAATPEVSTTTPEPTAVASNPKPSDEVTFFGTSAADRSGDPAADLERQVAEYVVPPAWLNSVQPRWSTSKPWKEGRQEIRRLLGLGDDRSRREGIKLMWQYREKNDIGDGHEYGMYLFLGGEPIWAIKAYREWVAKPQHNYPPFMGIKALASLYTDYGVYEEAEKLLKRGVKMRPPQRAWYEEREAEMHDSLGDLYVAWGKPDEARKSYLEAARLYPLGKPPYGRHLLPRKAKKVQSKLNLLSMQSQGRVQLRDGTYRATSLGYSGDVKLTVQVRGGQVASIGVQHQEKIDQNACKIIPDRIVEKQSLMVDGVSGATVTKDAIVTGTLEALRKAGLR